MTSQRINHVKAKSLSIRARKNCMEKTWICTSGCRGYAWVNRLRSWDHSDTTINLETGYSPQVKVENYKPTPISRYGNAFGTSQRVNENRARPARSLCCTTLKYHHRGSHSTTCVVYSCLGRKCQLSCRDWWDKRRIWDGSWRPTMDTNWSYYIWYATWRSILSVAFFPTVRLFLSIACSYSVLRTVATSKSCIVPTKAPSARLRSN